MARAVFCLRMARKRLLNCSREAGFKKLAAMSEKKPIQQATTIPGTIILSKETPADFILESSYFSAMSPNTITDEIKTVIGTAIGISVTA